MVANRENPYFSGGRVWNNIGVEMDLLIAQSSTEIPPSTGQVPLRSSGQTVFKSPTEVTEKRSISDDAPVLGGFFLCTGSGGSYHAYNSI